MEGVKLDKWGYEVKTSSDSCISVINAYYHQVLCYGRDRRVILEAPVHDKDCVLANILAAHFLCSSDPSKAPSYIEAAKSRLEQATSYEKAIFDAVNYLISDNRDDDLAVELHSKLLRDFPRDLLSLKRAQVLCFYMGRPDLSLDLVQQLCHVLQYQSHYKEAVQFMEECSSSWSSCSSFMLTHNWWHVALCYLEGHSPIIKVREVYDHCIWKELEKTDAVCVEVYLNALGLLLRVYVRGELDAFEDRLKILAACLTDEANWFIEWHLDLLILWALSFTGELSKAEDLLKGLKFRLSMMSKKKQQVMQRAMLLAEAMYEYGRGNEKQALEILDPDFDAYKCKIIGASDEQLDVFNEVWYSMLLNTGQVTKAIESIEKQIQKREGAPFLWRLLEKGYKLSGRQEAATIGEKARVLEAAYFN
ncbi:uncharacterized protein LOC111317810 isoform X2 [Durio zibethinus]|uniref:Uncharacterized protein LOC111317810 isoform X2 n=1 Tax=Durio zibethinus TaxID=66656 RepID=A0A6P6BFY7_DURZI|nr:uncharacterized protein LOC111317810 isoform X2 [Durio zibethinus]